MSGKSNASCSWSVRCRYRWLMPVALTVSTVVLMPKVLSPSVFAQCEPMQEAKLLMEEGERSDNFGVSVSISGDTLVVGAIGDDENGSRSGSVFVFVRDGPTWTQQVRLLPDDGDYGDRFGTSVSIDRDTLVVGAKDKRNSSDERIGSAYVFVREGNAWSQQAQLFSEDGMDGDEFGYSVAIDGNTVIIGAPRDDDQGELSGSAWIFERENGLWTLRARLLREDGGEGDFFGCSVAVSNDTAIVGAQWADNGTSDFGAAHVFSRDRNGTWIHQFKLSAPGNWFGSGVSIDGNTALIGSLADDENGQLSGSAWIFVRKEGVWTQLVKLLPDDGSEYDYFGGSVSIHGGWAVVNASFDHESPGSAYVFSRDGDMWTERVEIMAEDGNNADGLGHVVSVHGDTVALGAPGDDDNGTESGSAYVFDLAPCLPCTRDPEWLCDGQVNPVDSGLVQAAFGSDDEQDLCNYDLDCDGQINPVDSGVVQSLFGMCDEPREVCP